MTTRSKLPAYLIVMLLALGLSGCAASPWASRSTSDPTSPSAAGGDAGPTQLMPNGTMPTKPAPKPPVPGPMAANGQLPSARMPSARIPSARIPSAQIPSAQIPSGLMSGGPNAGGAASSAASPQDLQAVMAEVEKLGRVDPRAQAQLLEELKQVDPSLWPMTVQSVWSRVAYAQRYGNGRKQQQLADRRSTTNRRSPGTASDRREINLQGDYPSTYPTTHPTTGYANTAAVSDLSPLKIDVPAYPNTKHSSTKYPSTDYPDTDAGRPNGPSTQLQRDNGRMQDNSQTPDEAPPWPNAGAALKPARPDTRSTARKSQPEGVIHTSYHSGPSEPRKLSGADNDDFPEQEPITGNSQQNRRLAPCRSQAASSSHVQGDDWRLHVESAIAALESRLSSKEKDAGGEGDVSDHARLRLLQLLAGRRNDALSDMPIDESAVRDFWSNELFGLDILLDTQRFSRDTHRAGEAKRHLSQAVTALGESAALEIRNLAFCSKVQVYGSIERFEKREFLPGQRLLLYAEIDNFHSENTAKGYHTSLRSSFQIFDSSGRRIDKRESTTSEDHCQSPRRDYFIGCDFRLPTKIYPGRHTLKLTVEDLKSHKVSESSIDFTVKEK